MFSVSRITCQFLEGGDEGVRCGALNILVRHIEDGNLKLCMSRHHEMCPYYKRSLVARSAEISDPVGI